MTDVIYTGYFSHAHQYLRSLSVEDIVTIIKNSPRPIRRKCSVIATPTQYRNFPTFGLLNNDTGVLVIAPVKAGLHAVSLYRTKNGEFVYYDSACYPLDRVVQTYLNVHGITKYQGLCGLTQYAPYTTCAYHSLTFLNYASSSKGKTCQQLLDGFLKVLSGNTDGYAVASVKEILSEFNHNINLSCQGTRSPGSLLPNFKFTKACKRKLQDSDQSRAKRPR